LASTVVQLAVCTLVVEATVCICIQQCWNTFIFKNITVIVVLKFQSACPAVYEMLTTMLDWVCESCLSQNCTESSAQVQDRCLKVGILS